jgi:replicative DNA helicase
MAENTTVHKILRSLCANKVEEREIALENFSHTNFNAITLEGIAAKFLDAIQRCHIHMGGPPSTETIATMADRDGEIELSLFCEEIKGEAPLWGANYITLLTTYVEERGVEKLRVLLQETAQVMNEGRVERGKDDKKGLQDAIHHALTGIVELQKNTDPRHKSLSTEEAVLELHEEYISRRDQPTMAYGLGLGLTPIDEATKGGQLGELWIVGGFTSHGKTTWALSWARYLATEGGFNVLIFSLEMSKKQVWRILASGHAANSKFNRPPLDYEKIKAGTLSKEDEQFYLHEVLPDLRSSEYGHIEVETPVGYTTMSEIRARAEAVNKSHPLDMILIDYVGLVGADKGKRNPDRRQVINENIIAAKQTALEFDQGTGVLVVTPHQINRQGHKKAQENGGIYEVEALSDANESERTSDVVLTIYQDQPLRQKKEAVITMLKNRDGRIIEPFNVFLPPEHRFVADLGIPGEGGPRLEDILEA